MSVKRWLRPAEAAAEMSKRAGRTLTTDDLRQLRNTGKIKNCKQMAYNLFLYDRDELRTVEPPKRRSRRVTEEGTLQNVSS